MPGLPLGRLVGLGALALSLALGLPAQAQVASTATTAVVLDQLSTTIDEKLEQARALGDYATALALARAKDALDAWKKTNSELMDKAFKDIDKTVLESFSRIQAVVSDANDKAKDRLSDAAQLTDSANQIVASLPMGRPYISRFQPRVMPPCASRRHAIVMKIGIAMTDACSAALTPERNHPRPSSCWRTASAEKHRSPSMPHPKVCAKKTMIEIGTNRIARSRSFLRMPR